MRLTKISQASKAGLCFPVSRISRYIKKAMPKFRVAKLAPVYFTAILEYMIAEITELSGNAARGNKRARITPRHIFLAIANDEELKKLLKGVVIAQGGVLPSLHPALLPNSRKKNVVVKVNKNATVNVKKNATVKVKKNATVKVKKNAIVKVKKNVATTVKKKAVAKGKKHPGPKTKNSNKKQVTSTFKNFMRQPVISLVNCNQTSPKDDRNLRPVSGVTVLLEKNLHLGQKLTAVQGDILNIAADAIVNPTNKDFYMGGQIGQILERVGGNEFKVILEKLKKENGPLSPSGVAFSPACNTAARHVIYCNGPTRRDAKVEELLEKSVKNCLSLADSQNFTSLAMPLIGSGRAGLPKPVVVQIVLNTINNYFMSVMSTSLVQIYLVLFQPEIICAALSELKKL